MTPEGVGSAIVEAGQYPNIRLVDTIPLDRTLPLGRTQVNLTLLTAGGGRAPSECSFDVVVHDNEAPILACPADFEHVAEDGVDSWYGLVPRPLVAKDNSRATPPLSAKLLDADGGGGARFRVDDNTTIGIGNHTLVYYATDEAGNVANCSTTVVVKDVQDPTITCPTLPETFATDFRQPTRTMQLPAATAADNYQISASASDLVRDEAVYSVGVTQITFTAEDVAGNTASCTVKVHVVDTEAPRVACPRPAATGAFTRPGAGYARLAYKGSQGGAGVAPDGGAALVAQELPAATFKDNIVNASGAKIVASSGADGTNHVFQIGRSKVAYTPIDGAGNVGQRCSVTVAVLGCPAADAYELEATPGTRSRSFTLPDPVEAARLGGSRKLPSDIVLVSSHSGSVDWPLGTTEVSWNLTTQSGDLLSSCMFPVLVSDNDPPTITCPSPMTRVLFASDNEDAIELEYTGISWKEAAEGGNDRKYDTSVLSAASASDASGFDPEVTSSLGAAGKFLLSPGLTLVNFTASDHAGNEHSCSVTYVVLRCPSSLLYNTSAGMPSVEFDFVPRRAGSLVGATPAFTLVSSANVREIDEQVSAAVLLRASHPGKHAYKVGTTNVSLSLLPSGEPESFAPGEHGQCSFAVTVQDREPPILVCPSGASAMFAAKAGTAYWSGVLPQPDALSDNVDAAPPVFTAASASSAVSIDEKVTLGVGMHDIKYTAHDSAGNEATCTAAIKIADHEDPTITCPTLQDTYTTDAGSPVRTMQLPAATAEDNFRVSANASTLEHGDTGYQLGSTAVTFTAVDEDGNSAACTVTVVVVDDEAPSILCPEPNAIGIFTDPGAAYATLAYHGDIHNHELVADTLPHPVVIDNSGNGSSAGAKVIASSGDAGTNHIFQPGKTTVRFTPVDKAGNVGQYCSIDVIVLECPSDSQFKLKTTSSSSSSSSSPPSSSSSSSAESGTATYTLTDPFDQAGLEKGLPPSLTFTNSHPESNFPLGTTVVTWNLTVVHTGKLASSCAFPVEVSDAHAPTVKCQEIAADQFVFETDLLSSSALFGPEGNNSFPMTTALDNSEGTSLEVVATVAGQPATGNAVSFRLSVGEHFITYSSTDAAGNVGNCVRTVTIVDNELPRISCPALPITYSASPGVPYLEMGSIPAAAASDNSGDVTVTVVDDSNVERTSTRFPVGETRLQYFAADGASNEVSCEVYVVVQDTELPSIQCPANTTVVADPVACASQMVGFPSAIADDNVRVRAIVSTHASPIPFTAGRVLAITDTATDDSGNSVSCTHFITFLDTSSPTIACPKLAATAATLDDAAAMLNGAEASATDNCDAAVLLESTFAVVETASHGLAYGSTVVNYTAADSSGNVAACSVSIYVAEPPPPAPDTTPMVATTIDPIDDVNGTLDVFGETGAMAGATSLLPLGIALGALILLVGIWFLASGNSNQKQKAKLASLQDVVYGQVDAPRIDRVDHSVVLTCNTPGAVIWYSWSGSVAPGDTKQAETAFHGLGSSSSTDDERLAVSGTQIYREGERLTVPVPSDSWTFPTLSVAATKSGMHKSQVVFAEIEVGQADPPDIIAASDGIAVTITCSTPGAQVWYSWDGIPTPSGASERDGVPSQRHSSRICTLTLTKDPKKGFGFAMRSSADNRRHVVTSVQPTGPAHGIIFVSDTLIAINGTSTVGRQHAAVMAMVQQSSSLVVEVERSTAHSNTVNAEVRLSRSSMSESFGLALGVSDDNRLYVSGVGLGHQGMSHASYPPAAGPSANSRGGNLQAGDVVVSVNGNDVADLSHDQVKTQIGELLILGLEVERSGGEKISASRTRSSMDDGTGFGITFGEDLASGSTVITDVTQSAADDDAEATAAAAAAAGSGSGSVAAGGNGRLQLHDIILSVNGKSTAGMSQADVMGEIGSQLHLALVVQRQQESSIPNAGTVLTSAGVGSSGFDATAGGSVLLQHSRVVIPPADGAASGVHPRLAAIAVKHGMRASTVSFFSIDMQQVATPDIRYSDGLVIIQSQTKGAHISWDLIESDLTIAGSGKAKHSSGGGTSEFGCKFALDTRKPSQKILQAYATKARHANSAVAEIAVLIETVPPPTISAADGHLSLQTSTPGATIVYEWVADVCAHVGKDQAFANPTSTTTAEVHVPLDMRAAGAKSLIAACRKVGMAESQVVSWTTLITRAEAPSIVQAGYYLKMSTATPGAKMYYRWNAHPQLEQEDMSDSDNPDTAPTLSCSPGEQVPIPDSGGSNVLYAIAVKQGFVASNVSSYTAELLHSAVPEVYTAAGMVVVARAPRQDADSSTTFAYVDAFPDPLDNSQFGNVTIRSPTSASAVHITVDGTAVEADRYPIEAVEAGLTEIQAYTKSGDPHYIDSCTRTIIVSIEHAPAPVVTIEDDEEGNAHATFSITCPRADAEILYGVQKGEDEPDSYLSWILYNPGASISCRLSADGDDDEVNVLVVKAVRAGMLQSPVVFTTLPPERVASPMTERRNSVFEAQEAARRLAEEARLAKEEAQALQARLLAEEEARKAKEIADALAEQAARDARAAADEAARAAMAAADALVAPVREEPQAQPSKSAMLSMKRQFRERMLPILANTMKGADTTVLTRALVHKAFDDELDAQTVAQIRLMTGVKLTTPDEMFNYLDEYGDNEITSLHFLQGLCGSIKSRIGGSLPHVNPRMDSVRGKVLELKKKRKGVNKSMYDIRGTAPPPPATAAAAATSRSAAPPPPPAAAAPRRGSIGIGIGRRQRQHQQHQSAAADEN